jgi:nitric oxide reductase NorE protein
MWGSVRKIEQTRLVGGEGIWTFICADTSLFAALFAAFSYYWHAEAELFAESQARLHASIGMANTIVLVTSSWLLAKAVQSARVGALRLARRLTAGAVFCGVTFIAIKVFEYHTEIAAGALLDTNDFFMFYYVMSGIHLVHVFVCVLALVFLFSRMKLICMAPSELPMLEAGAAYWHMVDLLWLFLFPLLYLIS